MIGKSKLKSGFKAMINPGFGYGLIIMVNMILVKGSVLTPLKIEPSSLHLYKSDLGNEFDYVLKRTGSQNTDENPDSKERRSQMGSSFIRFGRNHHQNDVENLEEPSNNLNSLDSSSQKMPRGRSDVIIRFGRSNISKLDITPFLSFDKNPEVPLNLPKIALICPNILSSAEPAVSNNLIRFCASIISGSNDNFNNNNNNNNNNY